MNTARDTLYQVEALSTKFCAQRGIRPLCRTSIADMLFTTSIRHQLSVDDISALLNHKALPLKTCNLFETSVPPPLTQAMLSFTGLSKNTQAAGGKGELLAMALFDGTVSPTAKSDLVCNGKTVEIKGRMGKLGLSQGHVVNKAVVQWAKQNNITLPQSIKGPMFLPFNREATLMREYLELLRQYASITAGKICTEETEQAIMTWLVQAIVEAAFTTTDIIMVITDEGIATVFNTSAEMMEAFAKNYAQGKKSFEFRAFQSNAVAVYLDMFL